MSIIKALAPNAKLIPFGSVRKGDTIANERTPSGEFTIIKVERQGHAPTGVMYWTGASRTDGRRQATISVASYIEVWLLDRPIKKLPTQKGARIKLRKAHDLYPAGQGFTRNPRSGNFVADGYTSTTTVREDSYFDDVEWVEASLVTANTPAPSFAVGGPVFGGPMFVDRLAGLRG
ncbi:hypothetical protein [Glutamicibacter arilaitensis]|uniref:hypothetical protein n=1 Tax=Glutamicibacter arilaitensis TaxID=256701 RepID=UPI003F8FC344